MSLLHLFSLEAETQTALLNDGLLTLERDPQHAESLEALMRAAHSLKGAARIVQLGAAERVAHVMEDCFVAAQEGRIVFTSEHIEVLLQGVDVLTRLAQVATTDAAAEALAAYQPEVDAQVAALRAIVTPGGAAHDSAAHGNEPRHTGGEHRPPQVPPAPPTSSAVAMSPVEPVAALDEPIPVESSPVPVQSTPAPVQGRAELTPILSREVVDKDRMVRVTAENLNRLMGLAGESLVESRWTEPFANALRQLKRSQLELADVLERLREALTEVEVPERVAEHVTTARRKVNECRHLLAERLTELELFARRSENLADRLYREAIASRMRPFDDGVQGFPRMVRDIARRLGKQVSLEIIGRATEVDRDILERLEAPLSHLLRNAIDHGIEPPEERLAIGKPEEGTIRLEAAHKGGMLSITVSDDGRGVELERLRQKVISTQLTTADMATALTEAELMEFLFLPAFSTKESVTEISGRGVGLDVVHEMAREVGGTVRAVSEPGHGLDHAGDGRRRGHSPDHGGVAVADPGGVGDGARHVGQSVCGHGLWCTRCGQHARAGE